MNLTKFKIFFTCFKLFLILGSFQYGNAQQVIWANKNNLDKKTDFTKVIGQNQYGIFILKHKNSSFKRYFIVEMFDKKMNLLKTKTFKIPGASLEKIILHKNGILYFTKAYGKGFSYHFKMNGIDSSFNDFFIANIANSNEILNQNVNINVDYNEKRNKFLIWYLVDAGENCHLKYHLFNTKTNLKTGHVVIKHKFNELFINELSLDSIGNFYYVQSVSSKFKSKKSEDFNHFLCAYNIQSNAEFSNLINNDKTFINSYKIRYNSSNHSMNLSGLYGTNEEDENTGYFSIQFNCNQFKIKNSLFTEFNRTFVANIIGFKNEQKGENLSKFRIKNLISRTDGGLLIIAEKTFITTQSDIFYVNGIPQSSYARIFNNDEIILLNLDSNLNLVWSDIINKNQASVNDGAYYNSFVTMVGESQISIMYNDKLSANSDIIQITYDADGNKTKKIILNNDQYFALIIPAEYNQVSANSIVLPINQNREFTYIKLIY